MRLIDADMLCNYCDNNINHSITPNEIMRMPFIDAEPVKHGRWSEQAIRPTSRGIDEIGYYCSECGYFESYPAKYCAGCGAKMDGGAEND